MVHDALIAVPESRRNRIVDNDGNE